MQGEFVVLGSGSTGNAAVLRVGRVGTLIDFGFGPQAIGYALAQVGMSWANITQAIITHTHTDHWNRDTLAHFRRCNIRLIAHAEHHDQLCAHEKYLPLKRANLVAVYRESVPFWLAEGLTVTTVRIPHDADATCALRFDQVTSDGQVWSLGYASDVGEATPQILDAFVELDALALEFNHDVPMQLNSRRPQLLIRRVLGPNGHLSNEAAASLVESIISRSTSGLLRHLFQLHLSRECNTAKLAQEAALKMLVRIKSGAELITTTPHEPTPKITLIPRPATAIRPRFPDPKPFQPSLFAAEE
ncbi:MAG: MBL fold metallo-hydrolase [Fimbriiglobus sp.]